MNKKNKNRAFLKWAGGKYALVDMIKQQLPKTDKLIEPFVGAGSVFLNTEYASYVLNDINPDLISLYRTLQQRPDDYIRDARSYFSPETNRSEAYYKLRDEFNSSTDDYAKSLLFLYLNRHCYNGLCRYNLSGRFNVPFGRYKLPYFPEKELLHFAEKAQRATFTCLPFEQALAKACKDSAVYCDPPYAPISDTAKFTHYAKNGFSPEDQKRLAEIAAHTARQHSIKVLISNHDTSFTRDIYADAKIYELQVSRFISQKGDKREKVSELLALY